VALVARWERKRSFKGGVEWRTLNPQHQGQAWPGSLKRRRGGGRFESGLVGASQIESSRHRFSRSRVVIRGESRWSTLTCGGCMNWECKVFSALQQKQPKRVVGWLGFKAGGGCWVCQIRSPVVRARADNRHTRRPAAPGGPTLYTVPEKGSSLLCASFALLVFFSSLLLGLVCWQPLLLAPVKNGEAAVGCPFIRRPCCPYHD
jgi:hypothetical protein